MKRAAILAGAALALVPGTAFARDRFDTRVFARIGLPGYPAHAYPAPNGEVWVGTYENPNGDTRGSVVRRFSRDGTLLRTYAVPGQDLSAPHGVQVATVDARGRPIVLDRTPARALQLDPRTGRWSTYATFLKRPGRDDTPAPNYAAWGPDGTLYVTDYTQGVVWRVDPGGGRANLWLEDPRLDGGPFGTTGLALGPDRRALWVMQGSSAGAGTVGNLSTGKLYRVPIRGSWYSGPMRQVWESRPGDVPDGFAFARSGRIYAALVGLPQQLVEIGADGREITRFPGEPFTGANGSPIPFDNPSSARFLGTSLLVANQSYVAGDSSHWAVLDVETGERGLPELIPFNAGVRDQVSPSVDIVGYRRGVLRYRLSERATVRVSVSRGGRVRRVLVRRGRYGINRVRLNLRQGLSVVRLRARDAVGWRSPVVVRRVVVR